MDLDHASFVVEDFENVATFRGDVDDEFVQLAGRVMLELYVRVFQVIDVVHRDAHRLEIVAILHAPETDVIRTDGKKSRGIVRHEAYVCDGRIGRGSTQQFNRPFMSIGRAVDADDGSRLLWLFAVADHDQCR